MIIPKLCKDLHKGEMGRILVVGGSEEYCGAPYFAGISSLKIGADLVYVISSEQASTVIKAYSPDLIVYPWLEKIDDKILSDNNLFEKIDVAIIGPGLSKDKILQKSAFKIFTYLNSKNIPCIIDGDGIAMICDFQLDKNINMNLLCLTPNQREFNMLCERFKCKDGKELSISLKNSTIMKKGYNDIIFCLGDEIYVPLGDEQSFRRCGGQGDILSGILSTMIYWSNIFSRKNINNFIEPCQVSSNYMKKLSFDTFKKKGRSMTSSDIILQISNFVKEMD